MREEDIVREMEEILKALSPNRQRYLLELVRASRKAEAYLDAPVAVDGVQERMESTSGGE